MDIIHKLRCKFDEPYRIKRGFGLSPIRNDRELKALISFCFLELEDEEHMKLNPRRKKVYENTIKLYYDEEVKVGKRLYYSVYDYIDDNVAWYWN